MSSPTPTMWNWSLSTLSSAGAGLAGIGFVEMVSDINAWAKATIGVIGAITAQVAAQMIRNRQLRKAEADARQRAEAEDAALMTDKARAILAFVAREEHGKVRVILRGQPTIQFGSNHYMNAEVLGSLEELLDWRKTITLLEQVGGLQISPLSLPEVILYQIGDEAFALLKRYPPPGEFTIPWKTRGPPIKLSENIRPIL